MMGTKEESILHDTISIFKLPQVFPKGWVSGDVSCKCDPCLHIIFFEKLQEFEAIWTLEGNGQPVRDLRIIRECVIRCILEILKVSPNILTSLSEEPLQFVELYESKSCVHFASLEMVPSDTVEELPIVGDTIHRVIEALTGFLYIVPSPSPIPEHDGPLEVFLIIEHHHTADTTCGDNMTCVE